MCTAELRQPCTALILTLCSVLCSRFEPPALTCTLADPINSLEGGSGQGAGAAGGKVGRGYGAGGKGGKGGKGVPANPWAGFRYNGTSQLEGVLDKVEPGFAEAVMLCDAGFMEGLLSIPFFS